MAFSRCAFFSGGYSVHRFRQMQGNCTRHCGGECSMYPLFYTSNNIEYWKWSTTPFSRPHVQAQGDFTSSVTQSTSFLIGDVSTKKTWISLDIITLLFWPYQGWHLWRSFFPVPEFSRGLGRPLLSSVKVAQLSPAMSFCVVTVARGKDFIGTWGSTSLRQWKKCWKKTGALEQ